MVIYTTISSGSAGRGALSSTYPSDLVSGAALSAGEMQNMDADDSYVTVAYGPTVDDTWIQVGYDIQEAEADVTRLDLHMDGYLDDDPDGYGSGSGATIRCWNDSTSTWDVISTPGVSHTKTDYDEAITASVGDYIASGGMCYWLVGASSGGSQKVSVDYIGLTVSTTTRTIILRGAHHVKAVMAPVLRGAHHVTYARRMLIGQGAHHVYDSLTGVARGASDVYGTWGSTARGTHHVYSGYTGVGRGTHHVRCTFGATARGTHHVYLEATAVARGYHRIANDLTRYEIFYAKGAEPDLTGAADDTFTGASWTSPALDVSSTYYFVLRERNDYDLTSQNVASWSVIIAADGSSDDAVPSAPEDVTLTQATDGAVQVTALYRYLQDDDDLRADTFAIWLTNDGSAPNPAGATTATQAIVETDGVALLDYTSVTQNHGATIKVLVRTYRTGDTTYSTNTAVSTTTADATGPTAPDPVIWIGNELEQHQ
jgi:hypothetical protein